MSAITHQATVPATASQEVISAQPAGLLSIPPELRIQIVNHLLPNTKRHPHVPCCSFHMSSDDAVSWGCELPSDYFDLVPSAQWFALSRLPICDGIRDVLNLAAGNKTLRDEILSEVFSKISAHFCRHWPNQYEPHTGTIEGLQKLWSPYKYRADENLDLQYALQNFQVVRYDMKITKLMMCHDDDPYDDTHYEDDTHRHRLKQYIRSKLSLMDTQRMFVNALNASRSLKKMVICATLLHRHDGWKTNIRDALMAFEKLRTDVELDIHIHYTERVADPSLPGQYIQVEQTLPHGEFPSGQHEVYLDMLRTNRPGPSSMPNGLLDQWVNAQAWLFACLPELSNPSEPGMDGDYIQKDFTSAYKLIDHVCTKHWRVKINKLWCAHDRGDQEAFDQAREVIYQEWADNHEKRANALFWGIDAMTAVMLGNSLEKENLMLLAELPLIEDMVDTTERDRRNLLLLRELPMAVEDDQDDEDDDAGTNEDETDVAWARDNF